MWNTNYDQYDVRRPEIVDYELGRVWNSQWLLQKLRDAVSPLVTSELEKSDVPFDPQDLEHQALFFLTTEAPGKITDRLIIETVSNQAEKIRIKMRLLAEKFDLPHLFRGLTGEAPDLNMYDRLIMKKRDGRFVATSPDGREYEVECRLVEDPEIVALFTEGLHYIHNGRTEGDAFGFYFKGDKYPWAVETVESSVLASKYKRQALAGHGINPDNAVELTRLYTLPGSPRNAISTLDGIVSRHYRELGVDAMFTRTMPSYSKTKSSTVAGGMDKVLCIKELKQYFAKDASSGMGDWEAVTRRGIARLTSGAEIKETHPAFGLLPAVDVFMDLQPDKVRARDPQLTEGKVYFFHETALNIDKSDAYERNSNRHGESAQEEKTYRNRLAIPSASIFAGAA